MIAYFCKYEQIMCPTSPLSVQEHPSPASLAKWLRWVEPSLEEILWLSVMNHNYTKTHRIGQVAITMRRQALASNLHKIESWLRTYQMAILESQEHPWLFAFPH